MARTTTAQRVLPYLTAAEVPPTAGEIADALDVSASTVTKALRDLGDAGLVMPIGEAANGARTWTLTDCARGK